MTEERGPYAVGFDTARDGRPLTDCDLTPGTADWRRWQDGWTDGGWQLAQISGAADRDTAEARIQVAASFEASGLVGMVVDPVEEILGHPLEYTAEEARVYLDTGAKPGQLDHAERIDAAMARFTSGLQWQGRVMQVHWQGQVVQSNHAWVYPWPSISADEVRALAEKMSDLAESLAVALTPLVRSVTEALQSFGRAMSWLWPDPEANERKIKAELRKRMPVSDKLVAEACEDAVRRAFRPYLWTQPSNQYGSPPACPRHGPTRGGLCRPCVRHGSVALSPR